MNIVSYKPIKNRTMIRFIKPGDIFYFKIRDGLYGFGRIISSVSIGDVAEIFDIYSENPVLPNLEGVSRLVGPIILDSYSLFDRVSEGEWRIVAHQKDFDVGEFKDIYFTYGVGPKRKRVNIFDEEIVISSEEASSLPDYSPCGDVDVKRIVGHLIEKRGK